jgi:hypothetical protein
MLSDSHAAASSVPGLWHEAKREVAMKKRVQIRTLNKLCQFESEPRPVFLHVWEPLLYILKH